MKYKLDDYKVGEIAKFYGVSVDTVRFYDRKGVLKPEKKSDNNYRTYNKEEFISMDYIMRLRSLGISIENGFQHIIGRIPGSGQRNRA